MDDATILDRISQLVAREHALRSEREGGRLSGDLELRELAATEVELDRCWDLLRQRRAKRDFGEDADAARARPASVVEHYWQ